MLVSTQDWRADVGPYLKDATVAFPWRAVAVVDTWNPDDHIRTLILEMPFLDATTGVGDWKSHCFTVELVLESGKLAEEPRNFDADRSRCAQ
ncbi:MAG: hypothetical protein JOZ72_06635 [Alphaproteobacteria bacterium]|nr:hypothetical protein [Alphaproteobacteria bacterium]